MNGPLERSVRERARGRCEYCHIPAIVSAYRFPIDHIIAQQHRGTTTADNLALSCPNCNYHKGPNIAGFDPMTGKLTRLFNPRRNRWRAHFEWDGPVLLGKTPIGRTTIEVLAINGPERVELRRLLGDAGLLPT